MNKDEARKQLTETLKEVKKVKELKTLESTDTTTEPTVKKVLETTEPTVKEVSIETKEQKKVLIVLCVVLTIVAVCLVFAIVYNVKSMMIDNRVKQLSDVEKYMTELDERKVGKVVVHLDGKNYKDLDKLKGKVKAGDELSCTITYDNDTKTTKKVVIFNATDKKQKHVKYLDKGSYGYIYLPITDTESVEEATQK